MIIRRFTPEDTEDVITLWRDCNLIVSHNDPRKDIERKLKVHPGLFLVGVVNGTIIATVMGGYEGHRGWINYLAVSPAYRGQGYGKAIVSNVEKKIAALGAPKINLQVRTGNTGVLGYYRSLGYAVDDVVSLGKRLIQD